jgi:hypothetical protein
MWRWAPVNSFSGPPLPSNDFIGENPPYGALVTYYLPRAEKNVSIDIVDASRHVIRHMSGKSVPGKVGLNRVAWDYAEDGPVRWKGTFEQNRGPETGADALPGAYTVQLNVAGTTHSVPLEVKADPRDNATPEQYKARHDYYTELFSELSTVDTMLNDIDARLTRATGAERDRLDAFKHRLTLDPRNVEDLQGAELRERILDLIARPSTSYQAPNEAQLNEAAAVSATFQELSSEYHRLVAR